MSQPAGEPTPTPTPPPAPAPTPTPTPPPAPQAPPAAPATPTPPRTFTQEEFNRFEADTKRKYREKAEADAGFIELGKKLQEMLGGQAANQTPEQQIQTLTSANAETVRERDEALAVNKRYKLAATAGLHPTLWDRLRGNTDEEILADIEVLKPASAATGTPAPPPPGGPRPNPQQGTPSANDGKTGSTKSGAELFAARNGTGSKENAAT